MPTDSEAAAQAQLQEIAAELEAAQARLRAVHASLPVSPLEPVMLVGEEELDAATEMRSVIECVLNDSLGPAIRDLQAVADKT
jgi:hypothetical protein